MKRVFRITAAMIEEGEDELYSGYNLAEVEDVFRRMFEASELADEFEVVIDD